MVSTVVRLPSFVCKRCGHRWYPRKAEVPLRCAACKSPYWRTRRPAGKGKPACAAQRRVKNCGC